MVEKILERTNRIFGPDAAKYLANKHAGGLNNQKGGEHEDYFCILEIAKAAKSIIESGKDVVLCTQKLGFVDDVVLEYPRNRSDPPHFFHLIPSAVLPGEVWYEVTTLPRRHMRQRNLLRKTPGRFAVESPCRF